MPKFYDSYHNRWISDINSVINLLKTEVVDEATRQEAIRNLRQLRKQIQEDEED